MSRPLSWRASRRAVSWPADNGTPRLPSMPHEARVPSAAGRARRRSGPDAEPLLRLLRLARPMRGRLALAVAAGAAATGCAVALLATSGFLLARASQHPSIVAITGAVVAVRAFSVGRGVFRYSERVGTHDAAFRVLADLRVTVYQRLERLAPACARSRPVICSPGWSATSTPRRSCSSAVSRHR